MLTSQICRPELVKMVKDFQELVKPALETSCVLFGNSILLRTCMLFKYILLLSALWYLGDCLDANITDTRYLTSDFAVRNVHEAKSISADANTFSIGQFTLCVSVYDFLPSARAIKLPYHPTHHIISPSMALYDTAMLLRCTLHC